MNALQRMIVIPPAIFEKFKHIVLEDDQLSSLDKNMKSILHNKKLSDLNKWHLYRQHLLNYSSIKRKNAHHNKFRWQPKHVEGVGVQTKRIFTKEKDTQIHRPQVFDNSAQTIEIPVIPEFKGVDNRQQQSATDDDDEVFTNTIENEYDQRDILNIRDSDGFRTIEMKNGDVLTEPQFQKPPKPLKKHKSSLRSDGYLQTEIDFPKRKSSRAVETITRSQSLRPLPGREQSWVKYN